jgi:hypothetical protein
MSRPTIGLNAPDDFFSDHPDQWESQGSATETLNSHSPTASFRSRVSKFPRGQSPPGDSGPLKSSQECYPGPVFWAS